MVQHYFASAWILPDGVKRENFVACRKVAPARQPVRRGHDRRRSAAIAPGAAKAVEAKFFAGPQDEKMLEQIAPGLELVKDYGWLTILAKPLYWLLTQLHSLPAQLGLVHHGAGADDQDRLLLAAGQGLRRAWPR